MANIQLETPLDYAIAGLKVCSADNWGVPLDVR